MILKRAINKKPATVQLPFVASNWNLMKAIWKRHFSKKKPKTRTIGMFDDNDKQAKVCLGSWDKTEKAFFWSSKNERKPLARESREVVLAQVAASENRHAASICM